MARVVRARVNKGAYTNVSEVVLNVMRRIQEVEPTKIEERRVHAGIRDIEEGRYTDYDQAQFTRLGKDLVKSSIKRPAESADEANLQAEPLGQAGPAEHFRLLG